MVCGVMTSQEHHINLCAVAQKSGWTNKEREIRQAYAEYIQTGGNPNKGKHTVNRKELQAHYESFKANYIAHSYKYHPIELDQHGNML